VRIVGECRKLAVTVSATSACAILPPARVLLGQPENKVAYLVADRGPPDHRVMIWLELAGR
jgi:hypothetical protein